MVGNGVVVVVVDERQLERLAEIAVELTCVGPTGLEVAYTG